MKMIKITTIFLATAVVLSGCSGVKGVFNKRNNGTLNYQKSHQLDPIKLPKNQASSDFVPLYPIIPTKSQNTLELSNAQGTQYQLPRPPSVTP